MRLGNPHSYGFDLGMFVERPCGYPLCQGLGKLHGRSLDDVARHAVDPAVVHGPRQVVGGPRGPQVEAQLDANDERLAKLVFGLQGSVAAMENHIRKEYAVLAHRYFSLPSIRISMPERKDSYDTYALVRKDSYSRVRYLLTQKEKMGYHFPASVLSGILPDERPAGSQANGAS
jgi:hypothetical protein